MWLIHHEELGTASGELEALGHAEPSWTGTEGIWEEGSESKLMFFHFTIQGLHSTPSLALFLKTEPPSSAPAPASLCLLVKPGFTWWVNLTPKGPWEELSGQPPDGQGPGS